MAGSCHEARVVFSAGVSEAGRAVFSKSSRSFSVKAMGMSGVMPVRWGVWPEGVW